MGSWKCKEFRKEINGIELTLFLSAAEVLLGWGPLLPLILEEVTLTKSLQAISSSLWPCEVFCTFATAADTPAVFVGEKEIEKKRKREIFCTFSTAVDTGCVCGLSALPRDQSYMSSSFITSHNSFRYLRILKWEPNSSWNTGPQPLHNHLNATLLHLIVLQLRFHSFLYLTNE